MNFITKIHIKKIFFLNKRQKENCHTPLQLANPTQLQLFGEDIDFVFPRKKEAEGRKEEEVTPT